MLCRYETLKKNNKYFMVKYCIVFLKVSYDVLPSTSILCLIPPEPFDINALAFTAKCMNSSTMIRGNKYFLKN